MNELRLATLDDVPGIEQLVRDAYSPYVSRIGREPGPMADDYRALVEQQQVQVVDGGGRVLGVLVLVPETDAMLLDNIAVSPMAQGTGLGRLMLQRAEQAARDAGYAFIRLYTNEAMVENLALYARLGYVETHRGEERGLRRVYLKKRLA